MGIKYISSDGARRCQVSQCAACRFINYKRAAALAEVSHLAYRLCAHVRNVGWPEAELSLRCHSDLPLIYLLSDLNHFFHISPALLFFG